MTEVVCNHCGQTIDIRSAMYSGINQPGVYVCEICADDFLRCDICGRVTESRNAIIRDNNVYCSYCSQHTVSLKEYHCKPIPQFFGRGPDYLGTELEMDKGNNRETLSKKLTENFPVIVKKDGSVPTGIEVVSHPCTVNYHVQKFGWSKLCELAESYGFKSHNTDNCGLHIHISRKFFGNNENTQKFNIGKLIYLTEKFRSEIKQFSRRDNFYYCKFYDFDIPTLECYNNPADIYQLAKNLSDRDRYKSVNLQNKNTAEFRIFRGTLSPKTLYASFQFCKLISELSKHNWKKVKTYNWPEMKVLAENNRYEHFLNYCGNRGI